MSICDKDLIPLMRHCTRKKHQLRDNNPDEVSFEKDEVVWILQVKNRKTGKSRPATSSDLSRTNVEFRMEDEELSGSLGLVVSVNKRNKTAKLRPVRTGIFMIYNLDQQCLIAIRDIITY